MNKERKHIRLRNFDYSSAGAYFITICTKDRECFFGNIVGTQHVVTFSAIGKIANEYLNDIPNHFPHMEMDEFIVMPNHVHCILVLNEKSIGDDVGASHGMPLPNTDDNVGSHHVGTRHGVSLRDDNEIVRASHVMPQQPITNQFGKPVRGSVSVIINQFKSSVTRWCNKNNHQYFQWQSRFHDHVIRNEEEYNRIKNYIIANPMNWANDKFYK